MGIPEGVYFYDAYLPSDSGDLEFHAPIIGSAWINLGFPTTAEIVDERVKVVAGAGCVFRSAQAPANNDYTERVIRFENTSDIASIRFGNVHDTGSTQRFEARWTFNDGINDQIRLTGQSGGPTFEVFDNSHEFPPGIHEIRIVGEGSVITAYFDGKGLRITEVPSAIQDYGDIGFSIGSNNNIEIISIVGRNGKEDDFVLYFDTDFGPVGASSGGSGGGGGSGGSPSGGGSNPNNTPCDPDTTLVINNGQVVSVAPSDPCQWTGLIWWKLICESVITSPDYAVETEVFFNTLSDPFMSIGPIVRLNEVTGAQYFLAIWNDEVALGKKLSASSDDVLLDFALTTFIPGTWYKLRLEVEGNILRGYLDDELVVSAVDIENSITEAGCAGFRMSRGNPGTDLRIDNFRVWLNVIRPFFFEHPIFLESISILKDDGMTTDYSISLADSMVGSESLIVSSPQVIHINEGGIFTDVASQVKTIREILAGGEVLGLNVSLQFLEQFRASAGSPLILANIPISEIFNITDAERTIHGITDGMTLSEFVTQLLSTNIQANAQLTDSVLITKTETGLVGAGGDPDEIFQIRRTTEVKV